MKPQLSENPAGPGPTRACPCGSGLDVEACCRPRHLGLRSAETAEALMRSRYAAFAEGRVDYLLKTLHPSKRTLDDFTSLSESVSKVQWKGLRVLDTSAGLEGDERGEVEFVAFYEEAGRRGELHERSRFLRQDGAWYYLDGEASRRHRRPGRRDRCWCGSGKLYRKCHGR